MKKSRQQLTALTRGEGSPWLWDRIGQAYMCAIPGHFNDEPVNCLRVRVQSDEQLLDSVLRGLPRFVHRDALHQDPDFRAARAAVGRRALRA